MRRREVIAALGGWAAYPAASSAQARKPLVGLLLGTAPDAGAAYAARFLQDLRNQGYKESQDFDLATRYAEGNLDRMPALARELVGLNPFVLVTGSMVASAACLEATRTIPIVCV